ncbi:MAG: alpha/beta fold hydrolase [Gammaproteobacteria bacterium]
MDTDSLLLDNRYQLAWNEYGVADGEPVFYFHGIPGSRLEAYPADEIARNLNIRLIVPDRPGYGASDFQNNFSLLDWPRMVTQLADKLDLKRFSILGYSGGGAYALACAHEIKDRIKHIALVSSSAPFESEAMLNHINPNLKPLYQLAAADYDTAIEKVTVLATSPESFLDVLRLRLPADDKALFKQISFQKYYLLNLSLAIAHGVNGIVNDLRNITLPWQFNLEDIQSHISIWHGRNNMNIAFPLAEYLDNKLKNTSSYFLDNTGHYFLFYRWRIILDKLVNQESRHYDVAI